MTMDFKSFLMEEYNLGEKSARDYEGRLNGIIASGIYNGEREVSPSLIKLIEEKFPNSFNHYRLTIERYIEFKNR